MFTKTSMKIKGGDNKIVLIQTSKGKYKRGAEQTRAYANIKGRIKCHENEHLLLTGLTCRVLFFS